LRNEEEKTTNKGNNIAKLHLPEQVNDFTLLGYHSEKIYSQTNRQNEKEKNKHLAKY